MTPELTPRSAAVALRLAPRDSSLSSSSSPSPSSSFPSTTAPLASKALIPLRPGEISLRQQRILTEAEYTSSLSDIIKRDFFPHLDRLRAENHYLTALEGGDALEINSALRKLIAIDDAEGAGGSSSTRAPQRRENAERPSGTPITSRAGDTTCRHPQHAGETPLHASIGVQGWEGTPAAQKSARGDLTTADLRSPDNANNAAFDDGGDDEEPSGFTPDLSLSLDAFQTAYTSEDNASFAQIMDRTNQLRKERFSWAYESAKRANDKKRKAVESAQQEAVQGKRLAVAAAVESGKGIGAEERLLITGIAVDKAAGSEEGADGKDDDESRARGVARQGAALESGSSSRGDLAVPLWPFKVRNALMYPPDADISTSRSRNSSLVPSSSAPPSLRQGLGSLQDNLGKAMPAGPSVNFRRTDFSTFDDDVLQEDGASVVPGTPSRSTVDAAIRGSLIASSVASGVKADPAIETPRVAGYGFVSPYRTPVSEAPLDDEVDRGKRLPRLRGSSLPFSQVDAGPSRPSFCLPPTRHREEIAHRLAGSASKSLKSKASSSSRQGAETPYGVARYLGPATSTAHSSGRSVPGGNALSSRGATPSSAKKRREDLTPAAKRLLDLTSRTPIARGNLPSKRNTSAAVAIGSAKERATRKGEARDETARLDRFRRQGWEPTPSPVPHRARQPADAP
ncbi:uncharacterized protein PFL1_03338 [Pseudozyma flocculosa PF-1]|uniref:Protein DGCR14 n=1 Tax=Pseudozyma flocculosa PF-1 TaxID=1277687 RepID=A0A061H9E2_9BASI|nr:uncharacterized protein PFL1_03338 [Pseudozyma flocculosa PF-1]EPQ29049.1 hypothetical protein PFL1_03338 [Pseudozyma flocculosa PF-1]